MKQSVYQRPAKPLYMTVKRRGDFAAIDKAAVPEIIAVDRATECHVTPPAVAARMVSYLGPVGDYLTLEPSAGTGNLSRALLESGHSGAELVQVERHIKLAQGLYQFGPVINRCFLEYAEEARGKVSSDREKLSQARAFIARGADALEHMTERALRAENALRAIEKRQERAYTPYHVNIAAVGFGMAA